MKLIVYISFFLLSIGFSSAQAWQDSLRRGKELYKIGEYQQAYQTFLEAQRLAPSEINLSNDIGNAAYRSQDYEMAKKAFSAAANARSNQFEQTQYWHNIGNPQFEENDYSNAIESYKQALRANPKNEKARYNLAETKRRVKQEQEKEKQQEQSNQEQNDEHQEAPQQEETQQENQREQRSNQENNNSEAGSEREGNEDFEGKLSERKEDRILDDLLKKEIETQRRLREIESSSEEEQVKSGKRW